MLVGSLAIVGLSGMVIAQKTTKRNVSSLADLQQQCVKHIDQDGFGQANLGDVNIQNETGQILKPCKLHLKTGSTLQMNNVQLTTKNLLIDNQSPPKPHQKPSHIVINHSQLSGPQAGFQIELKATNSTVAIQDSQIDYPLSVGIAVGAGDSDTKASLVIIRDTVLSNGPNSEGITLATTGQATFRDNQFELNDPSDIAILLGNHCELVNNSHANQRCQGP